MKSSWSSVSTSVGWMLLAWVGVTYSPSTALACADGGPVGRTMSCCASGDSTCHCCSAPSPVHAIESETARLQPPPIPNALRVVKHSSCDCGVAPQTPANNGKPSPSRTSDTRRSLEFSSWIPLPTDTLLRYGRWDHPRTARVRPPRLPLYLNLSRLLL